MYLNSNRAFQKRRRDGDLNGFTLMELLAAICIVAILVGLSFAGLGRMRQQALMVKSIGNLQTIGLAVHGFLQDNHMRFPSMGTDKYLTPPRWSTRIYPYGLLTDNGTYEANKDRSSPTLMSPFVIQHGDPSDYGASGGVFSWPWTVEYSKRAPSFGISMTAIPRPSRLVIVASCQSATSTSGKAYFLPTDVTNPPPSTNTITDWDTGKVQALFADGHVEAIPTKQFFANAADYLIPNP